MKISKYIVVSLMMSLCVLLLLGVRVNASGLTEQEISLTILCQKENVTLWDEGFRIYLVAEASEDGKWIVAENFKQYHVNIEGTDADAWRELASTLEGYVMRDAITPTASGRTDTQGILKFPNDGNKLTEGLYLILGEQYAWDKGIYKCDPFMVSLPAQGEGEGEWVYDVLVSPKFEFTELPDEGKISRKVLKVWVDEGHEDYRPETIKIQLLKDGILYDTVELNEENNWRYTWDNLDNKCHWTVVEEKNGDLRDYTVTMVKEGITFVITNTYTPEEDTEEPSEPSEEPGEEEPKLPQLGQLWWPVPILVAGGLFLIVLGVFRMRDNYEK